jgi:hypothetical protein
MAIQISAVIFTIMAVVAAGCSAGSVAASGTGAVAATQPSASAHSLSYGLLYKIFTEVQGHAASEVGPSSPADDVHPPASVTRIGIERTWSIGHGLAYTGVLDSDGNVDVMIQRRTTVRSFEIGGAATLNYYLHGRVSKGRFARIAQFATDVHFQRMRERYSAGAIDRSTTFIMVDNGKPKVIADEGAAPLELWVLEQLIDQAIADGGIVLNSQNGEATIVYRVAPD